MPTLFPVDAEAFSRPSFELLYAVARSYLPNALRMLKVPPADVDDLLHDIVLAAHRGLDRYEPRASRHGERLDPPRALKAWLSGIAWRQVEKRRGRAHQRLELPHGDVASLPGGETASSEQAAAEAQRRRILGRVLQEIRPERAEVLVMHAFFEMSVPDIARELGLNENTVKSRIARARGDALAAMKRLRRDEQSALQGSPLLVPFGICDVLSPRPLPGLSSAPATTLLAGALAVLAVGVGIGAALRARGRAGDDPSSIVAAREPAPVGSVATPLSAPAVPRPVTLTPAPKPSVAMGAPAPKPPALRAVHGDSPTTRSGPGAVATPRASDTMAAEMALVGAARRALDEGAHDRALASLRAHEQQFPHGALAGDREWLKARVRSALVRRAASAAP